MAWIASPVSAAFPLTVKDVLHTSFQLRDRYREGEISEHGLRSATGRLEARLDRLLEKIVPASRESPAGTTSATRTAVSVHLSPRPGLDATNHEAERAIRWMVIARKAWGGTGPGKEPGHNRSWSACYALAGSGARMPSPAA